MLLLGVSAAFKEFTIQSEEMKLDLHWPFKGINHTHTHTKSERERDHCRKRTMDLCGIANGVAGGGFSKKNTDSNRSRRSHLRVLPQSVVSDPV